MKTITLPLISLLVGVTMLPGCGGDTPASRSGRVAGGETVQLVASAQSAAEWTAARPGAGDLRPRVRGTGE